MDEPSQKIISCISICPKALLPSSPSIFEEITNKYQNWIFLAINQPTFAFFPIKLRKMTSLKNCKEIAISISVKFVIILQIIFCFVGTCIFYVGDKPMMPTVATRVANILQWNWNFMNSSQPIPNITIPPLIPMITTNLCLILCIKMKKVDFNYWNWKAGGPCLVGANTFAFAVSYF